jgi:hypothetical protein
LRAGFDTRGFAIALATLARVTSSTAFLAVLNIEHPS